MDIFTAPTLNTLAAPAPISTTPLMPPEIVDYVTSGAGFTRVRMSDGSVQTLQGTRADRNNNPGNLTGTLAGAQRRGAIGVDHGGNYIFPNVQAGQKAMAEMVLSENANKTIGDMLEFYAPKPKRDPETGELVPVANDPNNTNRFYPSLIQGAGFNLQDRVGSLSPDQQQALLSAMMGVEDFNGAPAPQAAPASVSLPFQQRAQNSGILPMIGGGAMTAARGFDDFVLGGATGSMINSGRNLAGSIGDMVQAARGNMTGDEARDAYIARNAARPTQTDIPVFPGAVGRAGLVANAAVKGAPRMLPAAGARLAPVAAAVPVGDMGLGDDPRPSPAAAQTPPLGGRGNGRAETTRRQTQALGLFGDPDVAATVAETTAGAVQRATFSDEDPKPLTKSERKKFSPESLGLIAFGLSLLGGSDMDDAMRLGLQTYNGFQDREDKKEREARIDEFISKQDPETQELMRLMGDDMGAIANVALAQKEQDQAVSQKAALIDRAAAVTGQDPQTLAALDASQLKKAISDTVFADAAGPDGKKFTAKQQEAAFAALEMESALSDIFDAVSRGYDPNAPMSGVIGRVPGLGLLKSSDRRIYEAAFDRFFTAFVPYKSGKTFTTQEIKQYKSALMPSAGRGMDEVNQRKLQALQALVQQVADSSNGAYDYVRTQTAPATLGLPSVPQIGGGYSNQFGVQFEGAQ